MTAPAIGDREALTDAEAAGVSRDPAAHQDAARRRSYGFYPLHPFLFAAASVLAVFANNLRQATFADILPALTGALVVALALYLAFGLLLRRFGARAAVLASVWVVVLLFYGGLFGAVNRAFDGGYAMLPTLPAAAVVLAALTVFLWRTRLPLHLPHMALNGVAGVLLLLPAWDAAAFEWRNGAARAAYDPDAAQAAIVEPAGTPAPVAADGARHPDIYYFIFDRYASHDTLAMHYDTDNGPLMRFLEESGFYVAYESRSNYFKTGHSVASTFHLDYLHFLAEDERVRPANWHPIHAMLDDHRVGRFLKQRGYDILQFGSWWNGTYRSRIADANHPYGLSEFNMIYLRGTALRPIVHVLPESRAALQLAWDNGQCQRLRPQIDRIKSIGERERPVFVFGHFLIPHGPENFDRDGRCMSHAESLERGRRQGYIDQVAYTDTLIEELVTALLDEGRAPPIIVVQSDEGPFPERYRAHAPSWHDAQDHEIQIKTSIVNAYYFPDGDYSDLYRDITPVNTYRVLFNKFLDAEFAPLPDRVYGFPDDFNLYDFFDVTDIAMRRTPAPRPARDLVRAGGRDAHGDEHGDERGRDAMGD